MYHREDNVISIDWVSAWEGFVKQINFAATTATAIRPTFVVVSATTKATTTSTDPFIGECRYKEVAKRLANPQLIHDAA